jgi:hypothetical protein
VVSRAIALEPRPVSDSRSSVSVQPSSIVVISGVATMTVVLRDAFGFPIAGATVVPSSNRNGGAFTPGSGTSDASGKATFSFSASVVDDFRLTAAVGPVELEDRPRVVVTRAPTSITILSDQPDPSTLLQPVPVRFSSVSSVDAPPTGTVVVQEDGGASCLGRRRAHEEALAVLVGLVALHRLPGDAAEKGAGGACADVVVDGRADVVLGDVVEGGGDRVGGVVRGPAARAGVARSSTVPRVARTTRHTRPPILAQSPAGPGGPRPAVPSASISARLARREECYRSRTASASDETPWLR